MSRLNQCNFIGRLGKDPEVRATQAGKIVANFSLAVSSGKDETTWLNVSAFDKAAEVARDYARKGELVFITAAYRQRKYNTPDGHERVANEFIANQIQLLSPKGDGKTAQGGYQSAQNNGAQYGNQFPASTSASDEDIPF